MARLKTEAAPQMPLFDVPVLVDDEDTPHTPDVLSRFWTLCGRCSGIPECCIASWIEARLAKREPEVERDPAITYVRCPACRATERVVALRPCPWTPCRCRWAKAMLDWAVRPPVRRAWLDVAAPWVLAPQEQSGSDG